MNHLGSTMLVYGTQGIASADAADLGGAKAAYDYRAFGARYLDPMLGLWISLDPKRQFASPYLYVGNGINPVNGVDEDGNFFEDGERCTEGKYVPTENQGNVSPQELDDLAIAERTFMASPGIESTLMSVAKYTYDHGVETRFWYDQNGQNSFASGGPETVKPGLGSGAYFHVHSWRPPYYEKSAGLSDADEDWSKSYGSIMALEIRTGKIYYTNRTLPLQYNIMQVPAGRMFDAQEFSQEMPSVP